jgi:hypothetical protein
MTPTSSPTYRDFSIVGTGQCKDNQNRGYAWFVRSDGEASDYSGAYNWCKTAEEYASKLIAVEVRTGNNTGWACLYQEDTINGLQKDDFKNPGADANGGGSGTGTDVTANGQQGYMCLKNKVRRIDSNCVIPFPIFSHGVPNFFSPIQEFGLIHGLSIVGTGQCKDNQDRGYAWFVRSNGAAADYGGAYNWCKTANNFASKLIAVEVRTGTDTGWACLYQKEDANGMQTTAFSPQADYMGPGDGTGTIVKANNQMGTVCLKNEVR